MNAKSNENGLVVTMKPEELVGTDAYVFISRDAEFKLEKFSTLDRLIAQSIYSRLYIKKPELLHDFKIEQIEFEWNGEEFVMTFKKEISDAIQQLQLGF